MANPFQLEKQEEVEWCWAAVGASINKYFRPDSTLEQCGVAAIVLNDNRCCAPVLPPELNRSAFLQDVLGVQNLNLLKEAQANTRLSFEEIQAQIDASLPVCVRITWFGEFGAHFVVIHGWGISASGEQWLEVADPHFPNSTILYDSFVNSYQDAGEWTDTFLVMPSK